MIDGSAGLQLRGGKQVYSGGAWVKWVFFGLETN